MKIIDLLNKIANGEEIPKKIRYGDLIYNVSDVGEDYYNYENNDWFFRDRFDASILNDEVEILDKDDKDIPPIPDGELNEFNMKDRKLDLDKLNYNFWVLKDQINILTREFNEYRKENE